jgi:hypothetical protein
MGKIGFFNVTGGSAAAPQYPRTGEGKGNEGIKAL